MELPKVRVPGEGALVESKGKTTPRFGGLLRVYLLEKPSKYTGCRREQSRLLSGPAVRRHRTGAVQDRGFGISEAGPCRKVFDSFLFRRGQGDGADEL